MFKNAIAFRLTGEIETFDLNLKLSQHPEKRCLSTEEKSVGFKKINENDYSINSNEIIFIKLAIWEKIIPPALINEELKSKIKEIEENQNRVVGIKEKKQLKDEIYFSFLPKALQKPTYITGFIDEISKLIVVDASSKSKAECFIANLRKAIKSLPCAYINLKQNPCLFFAGLANDDHTLNDSIFHITGKYQLVSPDDTKKASLQNYQNSTEVASLINNQGMIVTRIGLSYPPYFFEFVVDQDLSIKSIKPDFENIYGDDSDELEQETKMFYSSQTLIKLFNNLINLVGGEKQ